MSLNIYIIDCLTSWGQSCWCARDVTAATLMVKNESISLLRELNSIFIYIFRAKNFYYIDPQRAYGHLVTWLQTKNSDYAMLAKARGGSWGKG